MPYGPFKRLHSVSRILSYVLFYSALIIAWQLFVTYSGYPQYILPTPSSIALSLVNNFGSLLSNTYVTLYESLLGFILAIVAATSAAILISYVNYLRNTLYPLVIIVNAIPKVALAPLLILWFGIGLDSKVVMSFLISFFPILVNTITGLNEVPADILDTVRVLNATKLQQFQKIRFPSSLILWYSGLKVSYPLTVVGAVVAEFIAANKGLGFYILVASSSLNTPVLFAALLMLTLISIVPYFILEGLQGRLLKWSHSSRTR